MLADNPGLLHDNKALDAACLIQFNEDQRDSILAQYGAFFSTQDELELLEESARSINFADNVDSDKMDWDMLDKFLETNNPNPAWSTEKKGKEQLIVHNTVKPALVTTCLQQAHFLFPLKMVSH